MSFTLAIGSQGPDFDLPGSDGVRHSFSGLNSVQGKSGTLIFFTCNHCPYVIGSEERMKILFTRCKSLGINMVAIHSNETKDHPSDAFSEVLLRMHAMGFAWLAIQDESQTLALAYGAERTPHYFLFDPQGILVYSGRMDNSPRDISKVETHELDDAITELVAGKKITLSRTDSIGCNIKWWDKEKHWMPKDSCDLDYLYLRKAPAP